MKNLKKHKGSGLFILMIILIPMIATHASAVPHTFSSGGTISASQFNSNFSDTDSRISSLNSTVQSLSSKSHASFYFPLNSESITYTTETNWQRMSGAATNVWTQSIDNNNEFEVFSFGIRYTGSSTKTFMATWQFSSSQQNQIAFAMSINTEPSYSPGYAMAGPGVIHRDADSETLLRSTFTYSQIFTLNTNDVIYFYQTNSAPAMVGYSSNFVIYEL